MVITNKAQKVAPESINPGQRLLDVHVGARSATSKGANTANARRLASLEAAKPPAGLLAGASTADDFRMPETKASAHDLCAHQKFYELSNDIPARIVCVPFSENTPETFYRSESRPPTKAELDIARGLAKDVFKRVSRNAARYNPPGSSAKRSEGQLSCENGNESKVTRLLRKDGPGRFKRLLWNKVVEFGSTDPQKSLTGVVPTLRNPESQLYVACHGYVNAIYRFTPESFSNYLDSLLEPLIARGDVQCQIKVMACNSGTVNAEVNPKSFAENTFNELFSKGYTNIKVSGYPGLLFENNKHRHSQSMIGENQVVRASQIRQDYSHTES